MLEKRIDLRGIASTHLTDRGLESLLFEFLKCFRIRDNRRQLSHVSAFDSSCLHEFRERLQILLVVAEASEPRILVELKPVRPYLLGVVTGFGLLDVVSRHR